MKLKQEVPGSPQSDTEKEPTPPTQNESQDFKPPLAVTPPQISSNAESDNSGKQNGTNKGTGNNGEKPVTEKTIDPQTSSTASADFVTPPDGGWGWLVVLSSFMIHVIADGIVYSFGVFLTELVDYFQAGRGEITWVGSLQPAITFTVGPLSSALTNRYGCRVVTIAGAIVSSAGFVLSVWAPNHYYLYFTSGIMAGVGFGLIYLPAIVCVAQYFEKKRSFATGLAVCGSGFGTFVLAPVCKLLIEEYGWQGAMLLLGGFTLNIVVCGIIFRPLEGDVEGNKGKVASEEAQKEEEVHLLVNGRFGEAGEDHDTSKALTAREGMEIISSLQELNALPRGTAKLIGSKSNDSDALTKTINAAGDNFNGSENKPTSASLEGEKLYQKPRTFSEPFADRVPSVAITSDKGATNGSTNGAQISASQCLSPTSAGGKGLDVAMLARSDGALHHMVNAMDDASGSRPPSRHASKTHLAPLQRKDIFYSGNLLNIPLYRSQPDIYHKQVASSSRSSSVDHRGMLSRTGIDEINDLKERQAQAGCSGVWSELVITLKDMMSMELLKNPVFLMFGISNFFTSIGFNMPFIFLPDRAEIAGIDKNRAALLLSVIGIANTVGRMVFGYLSDRSWVNRLMLYNSALAVCGIATAISPGAGGNYEMLVAYAAVFGLFIGVYVSLTSVVLVDLLGLELLTNSFGLLLLFQGVATFIGPPCAGWLYDWTGSYDISFIVMGTLIAISGLMLFFLPPIQRWHQRRSTEAGLKHDADLGRHILQQGKMPDKDVDIGLVEVEA